MSRIGKKPILIPDKVEVKIEGQKVTVKGPKGGLGLEIHPGIRVEKKEKEISVTPQIESKKTKAIWGLTRTLIENMMKGVTEGYQKSLELEGIGFKAQLSGENLLLQVGFSHPVEIKAPPGIKFSVEKNVIIVSGINKELVGQTAATIRKVKPPEPYKGKGIRYTGETVRRKEGKKVVAAAG